MNIDYKIKHLLGNRKEYMPYPVTRKQLQWSMKDKKKKSPHGLRSSNSFTYM